MVWAFGAILEQDQLAIHLTMPQFRFTRSQLTDAEVLPLMKANELLRMIRKDIKSQYLTIFYYVASHDPCYLKSIEEDLGFSQGACSRGSDYLSETDRFGKPGLNWITKREDNLDARRMVLSLTPTGKAVIRQLKEALYG
jgi:DNA-binding MarR family transcriptional regulator